MAKFILLLFFMVISTGCGTSDSTLIESGHNMAYVQGFHDGRHSGIQEAGNNFETYIKDQKRYESDVDYQQGWIAGESEGKRLQDNARSFGKSVATSYHPKSEVTNPDNEAKKH
ncbi:hypothetical protein QWY96_20455 [Vibrio artabrorum]|uniref:Lipoprotein n=1 Tax=Vibrio artabrorum TaxID=446374 RepID=A0ABT8CP88_9VIBR|nr:hypothetical protein [Vibrio artabrorum]MDN3702687.1 hypothetical protein [Vibrio artabrorum]